MTSLLRRILVPAILAVFPSFAFAQASGVDFSASFANSLVPNSQTTLVLNFSDGGMAQPVTTLDVSSSLPSALTIGSGGVENSCAGATVTAVEGGSSLSVDGAALGLGGSCSIRFPVTTGAISSSSTETVTLNWLTEFGAETAETASVNLNTVSFTTERSLSDSQIDPGSRTRITYDIGPGPGGFTSIFLSETLPAGTEVAFPPNGVTNCFFNGIASTANVTANAGATSASMSGYAPAAGCSWSFDITGNAAGTYLLTGTQASPAATFVDVLTVNSLPTGTVALSKAFAEPQVGAGQTLDLTFTLRNGARVATATGLTFSDDLSTMITGAQFTGSLPSNPCGAGSSLAVSGGDSVLTLTGGTLAGAESCTFSVPVTMPSSVASSGTRLNETTALSGQLDGAPFTSNTASATLYILADNTLPPVLSKSYDADTGTAGLQNPIAGGTVTAVYTIENPNTQSMSTVSFTDNLSDPAGMTRTATAVSTTCGGSPFFNTDSGVLTVSTGTLAASATCTVSVEFTVPAGVAPGQYSISTSETSAVIGSETVNGSPVTAILTVQGGASVSMAKSFDATYVVPGGTLETTITLSSAAESASDATGLSVTDDLDAFVTGATLSGGLSGTCGATLGSGSTTSMVEIEIASLAIDSSCTVIFDVAIPLGASSGSVTNTTSTLSGTAGGEPISAPAASASVQVFPVEPLEITRVFLEDPYIPGASFTARYTINNTTGLDYTDLTFRDSYRSIDTGTTVNALAAGFCGGSSQVINSSGNLVFLGLSVLAGDSCTFDITGVFSAGTPQGEISLVSSNESASVGGSAVDVEPIVSALEIRSEWLTLTRDLSPNPVAAGNDLSVTYTIDNALDNTVTSVAFNELISDFPAGTTLSGTPTSNCGMAVATGASAFEFSGGTIGALGTCVINATFAIPAGANADIYTTTGGAPTGLSGALAVAGSTTAASFDVRGFTLPNFSLSHGGGVVGQGGSLPATFTIQNTDSVTTLDDVQFIADFSAGLSGLVIETGSLATTCSTGSLSGGGSGSVTASALSVAPSSSCTVSMNLIVPAAASPGSYTTTSSLLQSNGVRLADPASAGFTVEPNPGFAASFAPSTVVQGAVSTLTFTLDNSGSSTAATAVAFSGTLESSLAIANPSSASTTCTGGTLTAVSGGTSFSYSGGTISVASTCTVSFDVVTTTAGSKSQPIGSLSSGIGGETGTSPSLIVTNAPVPTFQKTFATTSIPVNGATTMTLTVDNSTALVAATSLAVTDNLPANMRVATPSNAATSCSGGTLTASAGSGTVSYSGGSVAASSSCTITVDVTLSDNGSSVNTTGDLTSSLGNSGTATATLSAPGITITTPIAGDDIINGAEAGSVGVSGSVVSVENGQIVTVTATDGSSATASNSVAVAGGSYSLLVDVSALADGPISFAATVSDANGSAASAAPAVASKDATPPAGQSVAFDPALVNIANQSAVDFTLSAGEIGASFTYQITDSGSGLVSGGPVTISSDPQSVTGVDLSGLGEGTLTVSVVLTDANGNAAPAVTDTIEKDAVAPTVSFDSPLMGDDLFNAAEASAVTISGTSTDAEDGQGVTLAIGDGSASVAASATVSGGVWTTVVDLSSLNDGALTLSADLSDASGNPASQASAGLTKDTVAPSGQSVTFAQSAINIANQGAISFDINGGEIGAAVAYDVTNGTIVAPSGTGTVTADPEQFLNVDFTAAGQGTLTLSVVLTDPAGNAAAPVTASIVKDIDAPTVTFDSPLMVDDTVNAAEAGAVTISGGSTGAEDGQSVAIAINDGGATVSGSAIVTGGLWSTDLDVSTLSDGALSLTADLNDAVGNPAPQASASLTKDTVAPSGASVAFNAAAVNAANVTAIRFDFTAAEPGAGFDYQITSAGGGTPVSGSGTFTTATDSVTGLDLSGLNDGILTVSVTITDPAGNAAAPISATVEKDVVAPALAFDTPLMGDDVVNAAEAGAVLLSGSSSGLPDGSSVAVSLSDQFSATVPGNATVTGDQWSVTVNAASLADGPLSVTANANDPSGNPAIEAAATLTKDTGVPAGFGVAFDQTSVNTANQAAISFSFTGGEIGADFDYSVTSSAGGTAVTGSGTLSEPALQVAGLDLSGLGDGTLTLSVVVTDTAGNPAPAQTATVEKDVVAPTLAFDGPFAGDDVVNAAEAASVVLSGTSGGLTDGQTVTVVVSDSASGSVSDSVAVSGGTWSVTLDLSSLADGALSLAADAQDVAGNPATQASATLTKDVAAPAGFTVAFEQTSVNAANGSAISFAFSDAETGASFAYTIDSTGGGTSATGTGTVSDAAHQVTGIDLSGLGDGTLTLSVVVTDTAGNASAPETNTVEKDVVAPTLAFDGPFAGDGVANAAEAASVTVSGTSNGLPDGQSVTVTVSDSASGSVSGTVAVSGNAWSVTLDLETLAEGALSLTADAQDVAGNPAAQATASMVKDTVAPTGHSVAFDQDPINLANVSAIGFTFTGAEVGAGFGYSIASDAGGTPVTGSGTVATADQQLTGLDLTGLTDGTVTLSVVLTDAAGNAAVPVTDESLKDVALPSVAFDGPLMSDDVVNGAEATAVTISGTTTDVEDGQTVSIGVAGTGTTARTATVTVTGNVWSATLDLSGFAEGTLSLTADVSDAAGNPAPQQAATLVKDTTAPSGYGVGFDQDPVNSTNATAVDFTFSNAEVGAAYTFEITSDTGTPVSGSGTIASAAEQISGLDLSGLGDGTLTLTVVLTDPAGNTGADVTATVSKEVVLPTAELTVPEDAQSDPFEVTVVFSEPVNGFGLTGLEIENGTASALAGSGDTYTFTLTPDHDGEVSVTVLAGVAQDGFGNVNEASDAAVATADLTGTPNPTPPADSDGDGVPDIYETGDRDGDGIPDASDYDPQGYFYCEDDGRILPGGGITVSGPSGSNSSLGLQNDINIVRDGSTGEIQWFATRPGTYSVTYNYPTDEGLPSSARTSAGTLDVTSILPDNPGVLGSSEVGGTGFLADGSLGANPAFYSTFVIEAGDPDVLTNNIPMTQCAENPVSVTALVNGAEANDGTPVAAEFVIAQGRVSALATTVSYTLSGSATSDVDYTAPGGVATIPAGDLSVTLSVPVLEDGLIEGDETIALTLTDVTAGDTVTILSADAAERSATALIRDDDAAVIAVTDLDLTTSESGNDDASMRFVLMGRPSSNVTLSLAGDDQCTVSPATITFTPGNYDSPQLLTISAINDEKVEGTHSCQPTVTVASGDSRFDGFALALSQVVVTDDLVDQIRDPLTEILKDDLEQTVRTQQRSFSRIAKGALTRLKEGQDAQDCGSITEPDVNGRLSIEDDTGSSDGKFGWDVYNCYTMRREILDGSFSLNWSADAGTQAMLQFSRQSEKFLSETALHGFFWGGYYSRNAVEGLADGTINGFGLNGGVYGARTVAQGLFLDYYASAAVGTHRYDLTFDAAAGDIDATGSYDYAAVFGGIALSGVREYESFTMSPRVGLDLAHAWVSDASVSASQLGQTDTGRIDLPNFSGGRFFAEIEFGGLGTKDGAAQLGEMLTDMSLTPRVACEFSSYGDGTECSAGLNVSVLMSRPSKHLSYGFELDYERMNDLNRLTLDFTRERKFARGQGAVVTRLSMPAPDAVTVEHGVTLDF
ncbi:Ig-like domain-containing protein [Primorskyibacter sp. 2E107]|uniref:DUF7933 domain-containing protein n=1 Tax=Primorskyibacter sp. 2E107 TaxID=3403458 RepID=UPI003AF68F73